MFASTSAPTKVGAGLLMCCEGSCLLLRRSESSGNPGTWGLPGGNADPADGGDLLATALREAREELGELPAELQVLDSVLTRRGKSLQKHYTVFVATLPGAARAAYHPRLNEEHTDWRWMDIRHAAFLAAGATRPVSFPPVLRGLLGTGGNADAEAAATAAAGPPPRDMCLHPVVRVLFGGGCNVGAGELQGCARGAMVSMLAGSEVMGGGP